MYSVIVKWIDSLYWLKSYVVDKWLCCFLDFFCLDGYVLVLLFILYSDWNEELKLYV